MMKKLILFLSLIFLTSCAELFLTADPPRSFYNESIDVYYPNWYPPYYNSVWYSNQYWNSGGYHYVIVKHKPPTSTIRNQRVPPPRQTPPRSVKPATRNSNSPRH